MIIIPLKVGENKVLLLKRDAERRKRVIIFVCSPAGRLDAAFLGLCAKLNRQRFANLTLYNTYSNRDIFFWNLVGLGKRVQRSCFYGTCYQNILAIRNIIQRFCAYIPRAHIAFSTTVLLHGDGFERWGGKVSDCIPWGSFFLDSKQ